MYLDSGDTDVASFDAAALPAIVDLGSERAFVGFDKQGLALRTDDGAQDEVRERWRLSFVDPPAEGLPDVGWNWREQEAPSNGFRPGEGEPYVVSQFVDLDGDGVGDVVCAARHRAWAFAASGGTGRVLWFEERRRREGFTSATLDPPLPVGDVDGDGVPDFLLSFVGSDPELNSRASDTSAKLSLPDAKPQTTNAGTDSFLFTFELLSGKSGRSLWEFVVPRSRLGVAFWPDLFSDRIAAPIVELNSNFGSKQWLARCFPPQLVPWGREHHVAVIANSGVQLLDLRRGEPVGEFHEFGHVACFVSSWADANGDGRFDVATIGVQLDAQNRQGCSLRVHSLAEQRMLATDEFEYGYREFPLLVDLNDDERAELATATVSWM